MNEGNRITDRPQLTNIPAGSSYLVEAGDGSGTKYIKHEDLVKNINDDLSIGDLKELEKLEDQDEQEEPSEKGKLTLVKALLKVLGIVTAVFKGTDGIKAGTAGMVPAPGPEDKGKVLGSEGKWVSPSSGGGDIDAETVKFADKKNAEEKLGAIDGMTSDLNCENERIAASAVGLKKVNDSLGGLNFYEDEDGTKYVVGADSVPKKLDSEKSVKLTVTLSTLFYQTGNTRSTTLTVKANDETLVSQAVSLEQNGGYNKSFNITV